MQSTIANIRAEMPEECRSFVVIIVTSLSCVQRWIGVVVTFQSADIQSARARQTLAAINSVIRSYIFSLTCFIQV